MDSRKLLQPAETRRDLAESISEDLRALVLVLTELFEYEAQDNEVLVHILNAKFAAERGLILSERLAQMSGHPADLGTTH